MLKILFPLVVITLFVALPDTAFAAANANGDWVKPATGLLKSLEGGLVTIGALVVGVGIIIVGLAAAVMGRMDWSKVGYVILGGILVMAGPEALRTLLASVGQ